MKLRLALALLLVSVRAHAAAPTTGKEQLRQLIRLPQLNATGGLRFDSDRGFQLVVEGRDFPAELAALRKQVAAAPTDPALLVQLGNLLFAEKQQEEAVTVFGRAAELYRARVGARPADGLLLTEFADALDRAGQQAEAERHYREAVRLTPKEAKCWLEWGKFAMVQIWPALAKGFDRRGEGWDKLVAHLAERRPAAEQIQQARQYLRESREACARAVELAPQEPELFLQRGLNTGMANFLDKLIAWFRGDAEMPHVHQEMFPLESLPDFKKAARLAPDSYRVNATALMFELSIHAMRQPEAMGEGRLWSALTDEARQSIGFGLARLEQISSGANPRDAAGAAEMLGLFHIMLRQDFARATGCARRAVELDPTREQAWEVLMGAAAASENYEELLRICQDRLKQRDTPRHRLAVAKSLFYLKRDEATAEQVKLVLQRHPDDLIAHLAQAALLMRRARDAAALAEVERLLRRADSLMEAFAKSSRDETQTQLTRKDLTLAKSLYAALRDDPAAARRLVQQVLAADPNHAYAKEIQAALGK